MSQLNTAISLTTFAEVKAWLSAAGQSIEKDAMWIYYSGSNATATVTVQDEALVLTAASTVTIDITAAAYDTMAELVAYINASVTDWNAGLLCNGSAESAYLLTTGALNAKGSANEVTLKIEDAFLVETLINRASDLMNRSVGYTLKTTTYTNEVYYGEGAAMLYLDNYPVTRVVSVGYGRSIALGIKNTSTDANYCTVEVTATTIRLVVSGGDNADDSALTLADYASIDLLVTAIEALSKGWSVTTYDSASSTRDAAMLLPRPSEVCTATASVDVEVPAGYLSDYKVALGGRADNPGALYRSGGWNAGTEYFITYTAGYATIPAMLEEICIRLVAYKYGQAGRAGAEDIKKENFGEGADYSYERFNLVDMKQAIPGELQAQLDLFKKVDI